MTAPETVDPETGVDEPGIPGTRAPETAARGRPLPGAVDPADDGRADALLAAALTGSHSGAASELGIASGAEVRAAFARARVFVAIEPVARTSDPATGADRDTGADRESYMALLTLRVPSGATAVPAFTSVAALAAWRPAARPVPVGGAALCAEALRSGHAAVVLDPGSDRSVTVDGGDLAALADQVASADPAAPGAGPVSRPGSPAGELALRAPRSHRWARRRALARALRPLAGGPRIWAAELTEDPAAEPVDWRPVLVVGLSPNPPARSGTSRPSGQSGPSGPSGQSGPSGRPGRPGSIGSGPGPEAAADLVRDALAAAGEPAPELVVVDAGRAAALGPLLGPDLLAGRRFDRISAWIDPVE